MKKILIFLVGLILAVALTACGNQPSDGNHEQASGEEQGFSVTMTDAGGKKVTLKDKPARIISLVPSNTEILYKLGLGKQVAGVTDNDDYPKEVAVKPSVGGMKLDVEKIISLKPDLVLAQSINDQKVIGQLRKAGINVFVVKNATDFEGVYETIEQIGRLTGESEQAETVVENMKQKIADVQKKLQNRPSDAKKKVWVEISPPPEIYTTGQGTFMDAILKKIGAENAAGSLEGFPKVSEEKALKMNPDVILLAYGGDGIVEETLGRKAWSSVNAIKEKQVFQIDSDIISRPGPRLAEGVEAVAKKVYPKAFD